MSTSYRRGISQHLMVESFERLHKHMRTLGYTDQESTRGAIALTLALSGEYTREQALVDTNEIMALAALKLALSNKLTDQQGWEAADAILATPHRQDGIDGTETNHTATHENER